MNDESPKRGAPSFTASAAKLEEGGFEALQRLYSEAVSDAVGTAEVCARLLLGLYNGIRFPFDLSALRRQPAELFEDAMTALRMDARLMRQQVHHYFAEGSAKFEQLAADHGVIDVERLQAGGDGQPRPAPEQGTLCSGDHVSARLLSCGEAPGYRDVTLVLDCEVVGGERQVVGPVRLELNLGAPDAVGLLQPIQHVHAFAWRQPDRAPLDAAPGEQRPAWLDQPPALG